ncbi:MAG: hypothetical protein KAT09_06495 [Candidatus Aegiribacteria sp.]|nr:hypothetical protein [Candidatus Aegiribacteria sp.]
MIDSALATVIMGLATTASTSAANAAARALKASGVIIKLKSDEFTKILLRTTDPLIVVSPSGYKKRKTKYLLSWKGFVFYCETKEQMVLPRDAETILADKIWIPG